jgi:hypothetical protein
MRRFLNILSIILGFSLPISATGGQTTDENQLAAGFLYNIAKFVEWPPEAFKSPDDPIVCCMLGDGPYERKLEQLTNHRFVEKRRFVFKHAVNAAQLSNCHILYIKPSEMKRWEMLANEVKGRGILTVGEAEQFIPEGGLIRFSFDSGKVRIQINAEAAKREKLRINSKLLSLARIMEEKP